MKTYAEITEKYKPSSNRGIKWEPNPIYDGIFDNHDFYERLDITIAFGKNNLDDGNLRSNKGEYFCIIYNLDDAFYKTGLSSFKDSQKEIEKYYLDLEKLNSSGELKRFAASKGFKKET